MIKFLVCSFILCSSSLSAMTPEQIEQVGKDYWAYRPPVSHPVPDNEGAWGNNNIDAFIFENLKKHHLTPSELAA